MPDFLCFNTDRRDHAGLYGVAFYDVELIGRQKAMADPLQPGDTCLVATPAAEGEKIEFGWFRFLHDKVMPMPDDPGTKVRVLFGKRLPQSQTLSKADAIATQPYSRFFKRDGSFKTGLAVMKG